MPLGDPRTLACRHVSPADAESPDAPPAGVVVVGMHRSGTSALTRVVNLLGLRVGPSEGLIGPSEGNRRGHWEAEALSELDEDLLLHLGGRWSGPPELRGEELAALAVAEWGRRARDVFASALPAEGWVWKDPRVCLLLPFWRAVLEAPPVVLAVVRNPLEIAASLERRNDMRTPYSLALWERYQRAAIAGAAGCATYVVSYDELLGDPRAVWEALAGFLASNGMAVDEQRGFQEAMEFLDRGERHHVLGSDALDRHRGATKEQVALWEVLRDRTGEQTGRWGEGLPPETPGLQLAFDEHHRMGRHFDFEVQLRSGLEELQANAAAEHERLSGELKRLYADFVASRQDAEHAWSEVRRLEGVYDECAEGRTAVVEALERTMLERDGYRWAVLQHERHWWRRGRHKLQELVRGGPR